MLNAAAESLNTEIYRGDENVIILNIVEQATFHCPFDNINLYPFEIQKCTFYIKIEGPDKFITRLSPWNLSVSAVSAKGNVKGQYFIVDWTMSETEGEYAENDDNLNLRHAELGSGDPAVGVTVTLSRRLGAVFLVTYLPTILMNIINQSTVYIT